MSAVSAAQGARVFAAVRWTAGPLSFEIASSHPGVLERARVVFAPWVNGKHLATPSARFRVEPDGEPSRGRWRVQPDGGEPSTARSLDLALAAVEYGAIAALHAPHSGVLVLHAALVSRGDRAVLVVGPKEAGKSTLACALWRAGWRLHSDDNALIEDGPRARGIPRRVSLRATSRRLLGPELWERIRSLPATTRTRNGVLFHPAEALPATGPASVDVAAVIFLARRGAMADRGRIDPLDAGRALLALAPYSNRREAGIGQALEVLQPLAHRAPAFDLGRGSLATMVERVEELIAP